MCFEQDISVKEPGLQPFCDLTLLKCVLGSDRSDFPREYKVSGPFFMACPIASDRGSEDMRPSGAPKPAGAFSLFFFFFSSKLSKRNIGD